MGYFKKEITQMVLIWLKFAAYFQVLTNVDYESEVEDDILPIFRKGEVKILIFIIFSNVLKLFFAFETKE